RGLARQKCSASICFHHSIPFNKFHFKNGRIGIYTSIGNHDRDWSQYRLAVLDETSHRLWLSHIQSLSMETREVRKLALGGFERIVTEISYSDSCPILIERLGNTKADS